MRTENGSIGELYEKGLCLNVHRTNVWNSIFIGNKKTTWVI